MRLATYLIATVALAARTGVAITTPIAQDSSNTTKIPPPSVDPFYNVPDGIEDLPPGTVLRHRKPPSPITGFTFSADEFLRDAYQILYRTNDRTNAATATVVTVLIPHNPDFGKVVSLESAEDAASIDCAPSFGFQQASSLYPKLESPTAQLQVLIAEDLLNRGWIVIVPDIQGPKAAYPPREIAAYASLDAIRATLNAADLTGVKQDAKFAIWGYSGGASAGLATVQVMPSYAPELNIVAAAIGGGTGDRPTSINLISHLNKSPTSNFIVIGVLGAAGQDPEFAKEVEAHLKPEYRDHFYQAKHECLDAAKKTYANEDILQMFDDPSFLNDITEIGAPNYTDIAPTVPIYWYQSKIDQLVPAWLAETAVQNLCSQGANIHFVLDSVANVSHASYSVYGTEASLDWLGEALEGKKPAMGCSTAMVETREVPRKFVEIFPPALQKVIYQFAASMEA